MEGSTGRQHHMWVTMEKIQFVGACNPSTDPGRKPLSHRYGGGHYLGMCVFRQYCTYVNCVSCGIYMYVCVSEYVHDWQIHGSNVNEISIAIIRNHTILE